MIKIGSKAFDEMAAADQLHGPFSPGDVRQGDPIEAILRIQTQGQEQSVPMRVWRLSPLGVELVEGEQPLPLSVGAEVDLTLKLGRQATDFKGLVVQTHVKAENGLTLLGVRWHQTPAGSTEPVENRRTSQRWTCGTEFLPTGVAANPVRFNDFIHFRVRELSSSGLQVLTSLRNNFIIPGMRLDALVSFPSIGQVRMEIQILHASVVPENGKDFLMLGAKLLNPTASVRQLIAQYILQFGPPTTLEELRAADLHVASSAKAMDFGFVRTADEYRGVLALRKMAYAEANKLPQDLPTEQTADIFDTRSRILFGRYRGEIVATLRLMFHEPKDLFEHEQYVALPPDLPPKGEMIEITRVCTHPAYRGSDLLLALLKETVLTCVQSKRRYALGSSTQKLLPLYRSIGCQVLDATYRHQALGGEEHFIFLVDLARLLAGDGVGPFIWNALYADIWNFIDVRDFVEINPVLRTRLALYRLARPMMQLLATRYSKPRAAKTKSKPKP